MVAAAKMSRAGALRLAGVVALLGAVGGGFVLLTEDSANPVAARPLTTSVPAIAEVPSPVLQPVMSSPRVNRSDGPATDDNHPKPGPITVTGVVHYGGGLAVLSTDDGKVFSTPIDSSESKLLQSGCEDTDRCTVTLLSDAHQGIRSVESALRAAANDLEEHRP